MPPVLIPGDRLFAFGHAMNRLREYAVPWLS